MANLRKDFDFTAQLPIGKKETVTVQVKGQYYPEQCSREEGVSFDIEEVWGGYYGENQSFVPVDDYTKAVRVSEVFGDILFEKIHEATTSQVEFLTGYKDPDMILGDMPDSFETVKTIEFPNPNTYPGNPTDHLGLIGGLVS